MLNLEYIKDRECIKRRKLKNKMYYTNLLFCMPSADIIIEILLYLYPWDSVKCSTVNTHFSKAFNICIERYSSLSYTDQQVINMSDKLLEKNYIFSKCFNQKLRLVWVRLIEDRWPLFLFKKYKSFLDDMTKFENQKIRLIKHQEKETPKDKQKIKKCKDKKEYILLFMLIKTLRQEKLHEIGRNIYFAYLIPKLEIKAEAKHNYGIYVLKKIFEYFKGRAIPGGESFVMTFNPLKLIEELNTFVDWLINKGSNISLNYDQYFRILEWSNHLK